MKQNEKFFDNEEKTLSESINKGEWKSDFDKRLKTQYQAFANFSLNKSKRINIRMNERDLRKFQVKAIQEGMPYQSIISMLVHKFNEGKLRILN